MSVPLHYYNRHLYHFTHLGNLESIIKNGILSTTEKTIRGIKHHNIAEIEIQNRRSVMEVTCGRGGIVHDYVPLYFCHRSPMLFRVIHEHYPGDIVYLKFPIKILEEYESVFTDASANTLSPPNFYNNLSDLDNLNWDDIDKRYWKEPCDVSRTKQAEALIYKQLPLDFLDEIIVENDVSATFVLVICRRNHFLTNIIVNKDYFFK